ncbi:hypothetical protein A8C56_04465 [Niabella ginsenosidivorans]|uniref:Uncharacterized protein n=1 Tax=Niabella ginsenosidivorans TaxID=1176587 RepID=A0A1A9I0S9_9BACT|nr:hypothetical protein [Niabella ginsenosidivorans]ANH80330.1 hypothetical protein A8C56_04465 [Niabella ginsenosidivorans]
MEQDPVLIMTGFRKTANKLFEELYFNFMEQIKKLDRQGDENVFQQIRGRYERQLQQQLSIEARELIRTYKRNDLLQLQQSLTSYINYCLSAFRIKINSL